jgi:hypothetical protein
MHKTLGLLYTLETVARNSGFRMYSPIHSASGNRSVDAPTGLGFVQSPTQSESGQTKRPRTFASKRPHDRSAPCPWLLWTATYVDVDAVDDDSEAIVELERCYRKFRKSI